MHGSICICKRLEISDKLISHLFAGRNTRDTAVYLFRYRICRRSCKIAGTIAAAKDTPAPSDRAVPVRTGHASGKRDLINFFPKSFLHFKIQGMIGLISPPIH